MDLGSWVPVELVTFVLGRPPSRLLEDSKSLKIYQIPMQFKIHLLDIPGTICSGGSGCLRTLGTQWRRLPSGLRQSLATLLSLSTQSERNLKFYSKWQEPEILLKVKEPRRLPCSWVCPLLCYCQGWWEQKKTAAWIINKSSLKTYEVILRRGENVEVKFDTSKVMVRLVRIKDNPWRLWNFWRCFMLCGWENSHCLQLWSNYFGNLILSPFP